MLIVGCEKTNSDKDSSLQEQYFYQGNHFNSLNQLDSAEYYYIKASELEPNFTFLMNNLGVISLKRNDFNAAYGYFLKAYLADETNLVAMANYGNSLRLLKNYEMAEKILLACINKGNDELSPFHNLGLVYYDSKRYDEAEYYFNFVKKKFNLDIDTKTKIDDYLDNISMVNSL